jgi:hypothetical protein
MKKLILILSLLCSSVFAEEYTPFHWRNVPVVCGAPEDVQNYIDYNELTPKHLSLGRESSDPDGEPIYMITYYENDKGETLVTADVPNGIETCILYHTFNKMQVLENLKPNT